MRNITISKLRSSCKTTRAGFPVAIALALALTHTACAQRDTILDRPTPPGEVEPTQPSQPAQPYRPYGTGTGEPARTGSEPAISCEDFQAAYERAKSPKIVLFLNRFVTDNLREWESSSRIHFSYQSEKLTVGGNGPRTTTNQGQANASVQHRSEEGVRGGLDEDFLWKLEEAFTGPLLACGATLVDRAMVLRLAAANEGPVGQELVSSKFVETEALRGYADLVAQIECGYVDNDPGRPLFRIKVVDTRTGKIVLSHTSKDVEYGWVATDRGYERAKSPSPELVGNSLSRALITELVSSY